MNHIVDQPRAETCAKGPLRSLVRTGALLIGASVASAFLVDVPGSAGRADNPGQPYVPAAEEWIEPGAGPGERSEGSDLTEEVRRAARAPGHRARRG